MAASSSFVLIVLVFLVSLWGGLLAHELGHYFVAKLLGFAVREVVVGSGMVLFKRRYGVTSIEIRLLPTSGMVMLFPTMADRKFARLAVIAAGLVANTVLIILLDYLYNHYYSNIESGIVTALFFALSLHLLNIFPGSVKIRGIRVDTDGLNFIRTLFSRRKAITPTAEIYLAMVRRYVPDAQQGDTASHHIPRILLLLGLSGQKSDEAARAKIYDELEAILDGSELSKNETILVLDSVITNALLTRKPSLVGRIDGWSLRALELAPHALPLLATRGGVLTELGHYEEARQILGPLAWQTKESNEQIMCRMFLGHCQFKLGNLQEAYRCLWSVRYLAKNTADIGLFGKRLSEIENEILRFTQHDEEQIPASI